MLSVSNPDPNANNGSCLQGSIVVTLKGPEQDIIETDRGYRARMESGYWKDILDNGLALPSFNKLFLGANSSYLS